MVTPVDKPKEDEIQEEVEEVEIIFSTSSKIKEQPKFDFAVDDTDRPGLMVYTVSTKPAEEEPKTLTILAASYAAALELAGINKGNTVKVGAVLFEG
jgi:hypothetical protein